MNVSRNNTIGSNMSLRNAVIYWVVHGRVDYLKEIIIERSVGYLYN